MMQGLLHAVFTGDRNWAWRRRIAITSAGTMLVCFAYAVFWDRDVAHASIVMTNSIAGLTAVLSVFVAGGVTDDHLKRQAENDTRRINSPKIEPHEP